MKVFIFIQTIWMIYLALRVFGLKSMLDLEKGNTLHLTNLLKEAWEKDRNNNPFKNSNHGKHEFGHDYE